MDVARVLYKNISKEGMTGVAVCRGLHRAIRALRNAQSENREEHRAFKLAVPGAQPEVLVNQFWVPYVHFGV
jgi:hypothetical protein